MTDVEINVNYFVFCGHRQINSLVKNFLTLQSHKLRYVKLTDRVNRLNIDRKKL